MGAFEDRLAAGYRKAERAPLRTAQTTTPTTETGRSKAWLRLMPHARSLLDDYYSHDDAREGVGYSFGTRLLVVQQEAAAQERCRLLDIHMADHDDATGWCRTCSLLTEGE